MSEGTDWRSMLRHYKGADSRTLSWAAEKELATSRPPWCFLELRIPKGLGVA
jgi:hypothetical protein